MRSLVQLWMISEKIGLGKFLSSIFLHDLAEGGRVSGT